MLVLEIISSYYKFIIWGADFSTEETAWKTH